MPFSWAKAMAALTNFSAFSFPGACAPAIRQERMTTLDTLKVRTWSLLP